MPEPKRIVWPDGKRFAFTFFEDPDSQTLRQTRAIYGLLSDLGFRTTIGAWILEPGAERRNSDGETCQNPAYLAWLQELQRRGFEIGLHSVAPASMTREEIVGGLALFHEYFGVPPVTMANHYNQDAMYWGPARLSGLQRAFYQAVTLGRTSGRHSGEKEGSPAFWGDQCRKEVRYCRNFVFRELNTLKACPLMPYQDPDRPYVNYWYASAEAAKLPAFLERVTEESIDRLEEEGGAAIVYTHFGHGFYTDKGLHPRFVELMTRIAKKDPWMVPVQTLLRFLETQGNGKVISVADRSRMERRWLLSKLFHGTA